MPLKSARRACAALLLLLAPWAGPARLSPWPLTPVTSMVASTPFGTPVNDALVCDPGAVSGTVLEVVVPSMVRSTR